jgi:hypothetical protein
MANIKISQLPAFTGNTTGSFLVLNDASNTATYKVSRETLFTGSLEGTASFAVSASQARNAVSSSFATNATNAINAQSASLAANATNAVNAQTASLATFALLAQTASFLTPTASYINPLNQTVLITGGINLTGSLNVVGTSSISGNENITGSLLISTGSLSDFLRTSNAGITNFRISSSGYPVWGVPGYDVISTPGAAWTPTVTWDGNNVLWGDIRANRFMMTNGIGAGYVSAPNILFNGYITQVNNLFGSSFIIDNNNVTSTLGTVNMVIQATGSQTGNMLQFKNGAGAVQSAFTSNASLLLGTPTDAGFRLDVNGTSRFTNNMLVTGSVTATSATINGAVTLYSVQKNQADQTNPLQIYAAYNHINPRIEFWGGTGARLWYNTNTLALHPDTASGIDLGTPSLRFGNVYASALSVSGSTTVTGNLTIISGSLIGTASWALNAVSTSVVVTFVTSSNIVSDYTGSLLISGSLTVTGSTNITGSLNAKEKIYFGDSIAASTAVLNINAVSSSGYGLEIRNSGASARFIRLDVGSEVSQVFQGSAGTAYQFFTEAGFPGLKYTGGMFVLRNNLFPFLNGVTFDGSGSQDSQLFVRGSKVKTWGESHAKNYATLNATMDDEFNTTTAVRTSYAGYFVNTANRLSGSNALTNIGLYASASGGQNNIAALFNGNTTVSGSLNVSGSTTLNDNIYSNIGGLSITRTTSGLLTLSGSNNVVIGNGTAQKVGGDTNGQGVNRSVIIGDSAVGSVDGNGSNSSNLVVIGYRALPVINTVTSNANSVFIGPNINYNSGSIVGLSSTTNVVAIGADAVMAENSSNNTLVGYGARIYNTGGAGQENINNPGYSYLTVIGAGATGSANSAVILGRPQDDTLIGRITKVTGSYKLQVEGNQHLSGSLVMTGSLNVRGSAAVTGDGVMYVHNTGGGGYNLIMRSNYSYDPYIQFQYGSGQDPFNPSISYSFLEVGAENLTLNTIGGAQKINLNTSSTTRLQVTPGGNILIGTTTDAGYKLDVRGTARVSGSFIANTITSPSITATSLSSTDTTSLGSTIISTTSVTGSFGVQVVSTDTVTIANSDVILDVNGRSGGTKKIRITNPQANSGAHAGFSAVNQGSIEGTLTMYSTYVGSYFAMETAGAGGIRLNASNGPITFYNTGSVETARLDNTGSLSLGFTSSLGHRLNVSGSGRIVNGIHMNNSAGGADVRLVAGGGVYDAFTFAGNNYGGTYTVEVSYANSFTRFSNSYNNFQFAGDVGISNKTLYIADGSGITRTTIGAGSLSLTGSAIISGSLNIVGNTYMLPQTFGDPIWNSNTANQPTGSFIWASSTATTTYPGAGIGIASTSGRRALWFTSDEVMNFYLASGIYGGYNWYTGAINGSPGTSIMRLDENTLSLKTGLSVSGSASVTGSVTITSVLNLAPSNPLPTGTTGSLATSGSNLYFHDGINWRQVSLL